MTEDKPGGKLTEEQSRKFIDYVKSTEHLRKKVKMMRKCDNCNAWIRDSWLSRLLHWFVCRR